MKSRIVSTFLVATMFFGNAVNIRAGVQTDPALTGAIVTQMEMLKSIFKKRDKTQKEIIAAEAAVTASMKRMHDVEDKVLGYMSNVQGAFQNLYQIKRAGQLVAVEIPQNMKLVRNAIKIGRIEGTVMAVTVGEELTEMTTEMMSLYPFLAQLVTTGSYNVTDDDGKSTKKKVNLLDSYERYYICNTVVDKLEKINTSLYLLAWEIQTLRWRDLFYKLDPEGWINIMAGANIVNGIISDWNYNIKYW